ncbi:hypothetical protein OV090_41955 [Nannocystis sp. RBIL2]|uniref:hypothetical protein n=1 Tax=Nannocystis sp. RBIL2 TaxID=2996788 RepID=UPI00226DC046|nr:hypothetical protein [Nannocystis sp. RBIL2]MCY1071382.1 hypothetical protein [Nannocystis sp. RBIL2]
MFKIRADQADTLADDDLVRRIIAYLQVRMPDKIARHDPFDLRAVIVHCFEIARSYAIHSERGLFTFVMDMLAVGPCFHVQPKIQAILDQRDLDEQVRLDRIVDDVDDAAWEEAARITNPAAYWDDVLAEADKTRR